MADLQQFGALVAGMLDSDNAKRKEAEEKYDHMELALKLSYLFQLYRERSISEEVRSMALVLTRRLLDHDFEKAWESIGESQHAGYIEGFLCATNEETSLGLQKKLADVISQFAQNFIDEETGVQKCQPIIQFIEHCAASGSSNLKIVAMSIIESVPNVFGADQEKYLPGIKAIFEASLGHEAVTVRSAAVKAYSALVCNSDEDEKTVKTLVSLVPAIVKVCQHVVATGDDGAEPLQELGELATTIPKPLAPYADQIFTFALQTAKNSDAEASYRHAALEIITSFCESAPNMVKKRCGAHIPSIIEACLLLMTDMDTDIQDWLAIDDSEEDVEEDNVAVGETSLDRIACALGGKAVMQPFLNIVPQLMADGDWRRRYAAIMGLSTVGEGCQRSMEPVIQDIVEKVVPFLRDDHPRVRYAACNALGQMSTDFAPTLQKKCHDKVVPALVATLLDLSCMRVAAHAGAALVNFSEDCPKNIISQYLPQIMQSLEQVLEATFKQLVERGRKLVLEQVITTVASVADAAQDLFIEYYDRMIGPLKYILENSTGDNFKLLRGKTIECVSLIGLAVGREKFAKDGDEIMKMLADTMPTMAPEDPQTSYMISSWTRICKVLGPLFAPYLPMVMPAIVRSVEYAPEVTVVEDDQTDERSEDPAWEFTSVGDNRSFGIRTAGLDDKSTACEMLVCYAREMKEIFAPYVEEVLPKVLTNLKFIFHESVRSSSAEILPVFLECVKPQGIQHMRALWQRFLPNLLEAMKSEGDLEVLAQQIGAIGECVEVLGVEGLTPEELHGIAELIRQQLHEYEERRKGREAQEVDEDADPEDAHDKVDEEAEEDAGVLCRISDLMHACFKTFGSAFYPHIESALTGIVSMIEPAREYTDRQWAVCMIDDVLEFAPQEAFRAQEVLVPRLVEALKDKYPEVRQAAAYGFGAMALHGSIFTNTCVQALPLLAEMIARSDARDTEEGTIATENAIAAVAKILKHCGGQVDQATAIPLFLSWLPTFNDVEESNHIYGFFADLVESNNQHVLGDGNAGLPAIVRIIVGAFHHDAFEDNESAELLKQRLVNILRTLRGDTSVFAACVEAARLEDGQKATLERMLA